MMKMMTCAGCEEPILDRYLLNISDQSWHPRCVTCCKCNEQLEDRCFSRGGKLFCRNDYFTTFGTKCSGCMKGILPSDLVRRARSHVFHMDCFTCLICRKPLATGEQLYILDDDRFICKEDFFNSRHHLLLHHHHHHHLPHQGHDRRAAACFSAACSLSGDEDDDDDGYVQSAATIAKKADSSIDRRKVFASADAPVTSRRKGNNKTKAQDQSARKREKKVTDSSQRHASAATTAITASVAAAAVPESREHEISSPVDSSSGRTGGSGSCVNGTSGGGRTKRMRTSFKHQQLKKMKSYFAMNHNPDSKALKELSQETNLSKRVLQVWFQNARAKWRRSVLRQAAAGPDVVKEPTSLTELPELSSSTSDASPSSYSLPFDTGSSSNSCPYEVTSCATPQLVTGGYTSWQWREEDASLDIVHQTPSFEDNVLAVDEISSCKQSVKRYAKGVNGNKIPRKRGRKPMSACDRI